MREGKRIDRDVALAGGIFGAAALVGVCCVGPALFLLFGVSVTGLSQLAALEAYRPLFMGIGGIGIGYAGWRLYRKRAVGGCDGGECATDAAARPRRNPRAVF